MFLLPTSSETKLMDKSVFYQKVGPTLSQLTRLLSTQKWSATTIFHLQCLVRQRPQPIFRSTLDPRDLLLCFLVKEKQKVTWYFSMICFTFRLQVSTFSYLCSGAYKGGLHNISNPKIDESQKHDKKSW